MPSPTSGTRSSRHDLDTGPAVVGWRGRQCHVGRVTAGNTFSTLGLTGGPLSLILIPALSGPAAPAAPTSDHYPFTWTPSRARQELVSLESLGQATTRAVCRLSMI